MNIKSANYLTKKRKQIRKAINKLIEKKKKKKKKKSSGYIVMAFD